ncbi:MetQ/NlpA family ABC transporter substrate-binding protein [Oceanobacillus luteolus]|uniref:MetQ/NlpA family ABC transporter substrate-binding protein n=1 Tax=Oceanobacillus luteolus TaxID=1274358 RepID=UPI0020404ECE|nr:MetQ/NlpA family ABC transporter substrate-binding protein [Oceanobacillus luteolus]MCM3742133.1 MetQ/NlpA family ABC transporter substrate-binding protein [Oceanobacillus luteolus]
MKKRLLLLASLLLVLLLVACGSGDEETDNEAAAETNGTTEENSNALSEDKLVVGVTAGPHEQVFEVVKEIAAEDGLEIEIVSFTDYIIPNTALAEGELDVNSYQHKPFMEQFNEDHGTNLVAAFPTTLSAIGVYSNTLNDINDTPENAKVGIPNDPTNGARALIIFEEAGLIELDEETRENATPLDIVTNELNLEFIELDAAQLPKMLEEVDLAVINGNYALENGLDPLKDSLFTESSDSPYVNQLVVREENLNDPVIEKLKSYYYSDEVAEFVLEEFEGAYQPVWK